jgi:hypothetical protein
MSSRFRWPLVILISSLATAFLLLADVHSPVRVVAALWFLLVCTGMAFVPLLGVRPLGFELGLGVALSIVLDTLVTTTLLVAGGLSANSGLLALVGLCMVGCALQVGVRPSRRRSGTAPASPS